MDNKLPYTVLLTG